MGQVVRGSRRIGLRERIKSVRIQATGTQFQNNTPSTITLKAVAQNFEAISYAWYKGTGTTIVGTNQNFVIAHDQVSTVETYRVVVKNNQNQEYEDSISISKVIDGPQGRPGQLPIQREWVAGDVYRNNDEVVDYIYHRITDSWWKLKPGYNNVTAQINPTNEFIRLNSMEQLAVNLLIAENANIAGFVFKDQKMVSQSPSPLNPNLTLDGVNGQLKALAGQIGEFQINEGLEYNKEGNRIIAMQVKPYQKFFRIDKDGMKLVSDDWYSGNFCGEMSSGGNMVCYQGNTHNVRYEVSTGGVDYYLKIHGLGMLRGATYKAALWVKAVVRDADAILVEKGGVTVKNGNINVQDGEYMANGREGVTGMKNIGGISLRVDKGIITGW
ncbi:hypothetical protein [Myroides fluvii]|uniref:hypothetical protein n=1 Tax=Myroides fluvii TaxID=2572594 RepID=UPI00131C18C7|nr:hypothetical protein [Myroides fluvii]